MSVNLKEIIKQTIKEQYFRLEYSYELIVLMQAYLDDFSVFTLEKDFDKKEYIVQKFVDDTSLNNDFKKASFTIHYKCFVKKYLESHNDCVFYIFGNYIALVHEDKLLVVHRTPLFTLFGICKSEDYENLAKEIKGITDSCVDEIKPNDDGKFTLAFYSRDYGEINTQILDYEKLDCDIKKNYNDDLPDDKIRELVNSNKNRLLVFYGKPGTGKTSYIKSLMKDTKKKFIFMDASMFGSVGSEQFLEFLAANKDTVFVFEDCEKMITKRDSNNSNMSTLLNLTDGLLGDAFKIKIICTFNTDLNQINQALLRKGRLSLKYEFKELSIDKTKAFVPSATNGMTLADIYNADDENDFSKRENKVIGFLK